MFFGQGYYMNGQAYVHIFTHVYVGMCSQHVTVSQYLRKICYRVAKTHTMHYVHRSFFAKKPYNKWLICKKRPATEGVMCIFATL